MNKSEDKGLLFLSDWEREQHKKKQMEIEAAFNRLKMADSTSECPYCHGHIKRCLH